jgi:hypothetical protein
MTFEIERRLIKVLAAMAKELLDDNVEGGGEPLQILASGAQPRGEHAGEGRLADGPDALMAPRPKPDRRRVRREAEGRRAAASEG